MVHSFVVVVVNQVVKSVRHLCSPLWR